MARKSFAEILVKIDELLKKERELSINQIAVKLKSQWRTAEKALEILKQLKIVNEKSNQNPDRDGRIFFKIK